MSGQTKHRVKQSEMSGQTKHRVKQSEMSGQTKHRVMTTYFDVIKRLVSA